MASPVRYQRPKVVTLAPTNFQLVLLGPGLEVLAVVDLLAKLNLLSMERFPFPILPSSTVHQPLQDRLLGPLPSNLLLDLFPSWLVPCELPDDLVVTQLIEILAQLRGSMLVRGTLLGNHMNLNQSGPSILSDMKATVSFSSAPRNNSHKRFLAPFHRPDPPLYGDACHGLFPPHNQDTTTLTASGSSCAARPLIQ